MYQKLRHNNYNYFHKYPFVRIVIAFGLGILFSHFLPLHQHFSFEIILIFSFVGIIASFLLDYFINLKNRLLFGIFIFITLFSLGFSWHSTYINYQLHHHFQDFITKDKPTTFVAEIIEKPIEKENSYKTFVKIKYVANKNDNMLSCKGKALVYFEKDNFPQQLQYGDVLIFNSKALPLEEPKNPFVFNYKAYLNQHLIYHYFYLQKNAYKVTQKKYFSLKSTAQQLRWKLIKLFEKQGLHKDELALLSALVFGYNQYLTDDVKLHFSNAGAMHILCVSGLHVGIIYMVITTLFSFIPIRRKWIKKGRIFLTIIFIWAFAFVTGLGDAAVRATIMFSLLAISEWTEKKYNSLNILAFSAFLMLLINPNSITYLSFQLSYIAVFSIIWLYPYIKNWWFPQSKILKYIWEMAAVSIAAQTLLLPILIFYFHKISIVFLITNLFAIPLASVILYGTLLFILTYKILFLSTFLIKILGFVLLLLKEGTIFIGGLSFSHLSHIWITPWQVILLYVFIFLSIRYILIHKKYILHSLLGLIVVFFVIASNNRMKAFMYERIVFHHIKEGLAINFINNNKSVFVADSSVLNHKKNIEYQINNFWDNYFMNPEKINFQTQNLFKNDYLRIKPPFILFLNQQLLVFDDEWKHIDNLPQKMEIDFLVINTSKVKSFYNILPKLSVNKKAIITGKTPKYIAVPLLDSLKKHNISAHYTTINGAFIYDIKN